MILQTLINNNELNKELVKEILLNALKNEVKEFKNVSSDRQVTTLILFASLFENVEKNNT